MRHAIRPNLSVRKTPLLHDGAPRWIERKNCVQSCETGFYTDNLSLRQGDAARRVGIRPSNRGLVGYVRIGKSSRQVRLLRARASKRSWKKSV